MIVLDDSGPFVPLGADGLTTGDGKRLIAFDHKIARRAFKGATELSHVYVGEDVVFTSPKIPRSYFHMILQ